jgi:chorismate mutase
MSDDIDHILHDARSQIDTIDTEILGLLRRRLDVVKGLARAKARAGLAMHDPARESSLLASREGGALGCGLPPGMARSVFAVIVEYCRRDGEAVR